VDGFSGVKEERGGAGRAESRGDLLSDDAALAHAGDDDAATIVTAAEDERDGSGEVGGHGTFKARGEDFERGGLGADEGGWLETGWIWRAVHRLLMVSAWGWRGGRRARAGKPAVQVWLEACGTRLVCVPRTI